nr:PREDICTED: uncharacterized threonine-rich GPI-anchored glycoprotein PJ4664.02-like [Bemisia tabaci]XP_018897904.1 PREDICTED: uncharacterized threonine-rich GPI-anchored glycoprotein PJ4664.02-like [Bemisia tabaci]
MACYGLLINIRKDGSTGAEFPVTKNEITFGSLLSCDVRLKVPGIEETHCTLLVHPNSSALLRNFSAKNPVLVNKKPILKNELLQEGDRITILDKTFMWHSSFSKADKTSRKSIATCVNSPVRPKKNNVRKSEPGRRTPLKSSVSSERISIEAPNLAPGTTRSSKSLGAETSEEIPGVTESLSQNITVRRRGNMQVSPKSPKQSLSPRRSLRVSIHRKSILRSTATPRTRKSVRFSRMIEGTPEHTIWKVPRTPANTSFNASALSSDSDSASIIDLTNCTDIDSGSQADSEIFEYLSTPAKSMKSEVSEVEDVTIATCGDSSLSTMLSPFNSGKSRQPATPYTRSASKSLISFETPNSHLKSVAKSLISFDTPAPVQMADKSLISFDTPAETKSVSNEKILSLRKQTPFKAGSLMKPSLSVKSASRPTPSQANTPKLLASPKFKFDRAQAKPKPKVKDQTPVLKTKLIPLKKKAAPKTPLLELAEVFKTPGRREVKTPVSSKLGTQAKTPVSSKLGTQAKTPVASIQTPMAGSSSDLRLSTPKGSLNLRTRTPATGIRTPAIGASSRVSSTLKSSTSREGSNMKSGIPRSIRSSIQKGMPIGKTRGTTFFAIDYSKGTPKVKAKTPSQPAPRFKFTTLHRVNVDSERKVSPETVKDTNVYPDVSKVIELDNSVEILSSHSPKQFETPLKNDRQLSVKTESTRRLSSLTDIVVVPCEASDIRKSSSKSGKMPSQSEALSKGNIGLSVETPSKRSRISSLAEVVVVKPEMDIIHEPATNSPELCRKSIQNASLAEIVVIPADTNTINASKKRVSACPRAAINGENLNVIAEGQSHLQTQAQAKSSDLPTEVNDRLNSPLVENSPGVSSLKSSPCDLSSVFKTPLKTPLKTPARSTRASAAKKNNLVSEERANTKTPLNSVRKSRVKAAAQSTPNFSIVEGLSVSGISDVFESPAKTPRKSTQSTIALGSDVTQQSSTETPSKSTLINDATVTMPDVDCEETLTLSKSAEPSTLALKSNHKKATTSLEADATFEVLSPNIRSVNEGEIDRANLSSEVSQSKTATYSNPGMPCNSKTNASIALTSSGSDEVVLSLSVESSGFSDSLFETPNRVTRNSTFSGSKVNIPSSTPENLIGANKDVCSKKARIVPIIKINDEVYETPIKASKLRKSKTPVSVASPERTENEIIEKSVSSTSSPEGILKSPLKSNLKMLPSSCISDTSVSSTSNYDMSPEVAIEGKISNGTFSQDKENCDATNQNPVRKLNETYSPEKQNFVADMMRSQYSAKMLQDSTNGSRILDGTFVKTPLNVNESESRSFDLAEKLEATGKTPCKVTRHFVANSCSPTKTPRTVREPESPMLDLAETFKTPGKVTRLSVAKSCASTETPLKVREPESPLLDLAETFKTPGKVTRLSVAKSSTSTKTPLKVREPESPMLDLAETFKTPGKATHHLVAHRCTPTKTPLKAREPESPMLDLAETFKTPGKATHHSVAHRCTPTKTPLKAREPESPMLDLAETFKTPGKATRHSVAYRCTPTKTPLKAREPESPMLDLAETFKTPGKVSRHSVATNQTPAKTPLKMIHPESRSFEPTETVMTSIGGSYENTNFGEIPDESVLNYEYSSASSGSELKTPAKLRERMSLVNDKQKAHPVRDITSIPETSNKISDYVESTQSSTEVNRISAATPRFTRNSLAICNLEKATKTPNGSQKIEKASEESNSLSVNKKRLFQNLSQQVNSITEDTSSNLDNTIELNLYDIFATPEKFASAQGSRTPMSNGPYQPETPSTSGFEFGKLLSSALNTANAVENVSLTPLAKSASKTGIRNSAVKPTGSTLTETSICYPLNDSITKTPLTLNKSLLSKGNFDPLCLSNNSAINSPVNTAQLESFCGNLANTSELKSSPSSHLTKPSSLKKTPRSARKSCCPSTPESSLRVELEALSASGGKLKDKVSKSNAESPLLLDKLFEESRSKLQTPSFKNSQSGTVSSYLSAVLDWKTGEPCNETVLSPNTTMFDFNAVKTPNVPKDMFVSPLRASDKTSDSSDGESNLKSARGSLKNCASNTMFNSKSELANYVEEKLKVVGSGRSSTKKKKLNRASSSSRSSIRSLSRHPGSATNRQSGSSKGSSFTARKKRVSTPKVPKRKLRFHADVLSSPDSESENQVSNEVEVTMSVRSTRNSNSVASARRSTRGKTHKGEISAPSKKAPKAAQSNSKVANKLSKSKSSDLESAEVLSAAPVKKQKGTVAKSQSCRALRSKVTFDVDEEKTSPVAKKRKSPQTQVPANVGGKRRKTREETEELVLSAPQKKTRGKVAASKLKLEDEIPSPLKKVTTKPLKKGSSVSQRKATSIISEIQSPLVENEEGDVVMPSMFDRVKNRKRVSINSPQNPAEEPATSRRKTRSILFETGKTQTTSSTLKVNKKAQTISDSSRRRTRAAAEPIHIKAPGKDKQKSTKKTTAQVVPEPDVSEEEVTVRPKRSTRAATEPSKSTDKAVGENEPKTVRRAMAKVVHEPEESEESVTVLPKRRTRATLESSNPANKAVGEIKRKNTRRTVVKVVQEPEESDERITVLPRRRTRAAVELMEPVNKAAQESGQKSTRKTKAAALGEAELLQEEGTLPTKRIRTKKEENSSKVEEPNLEQIIKEPATKKSSTKTVPVKNTKGKTDTKPLAKQGMPPSKKPTSKGTKREALKNVQSPSPAQRKVRSKVEVCDKENDENTAPPQKKTRGKKPAVPSKRVSEEKKVRVSLGRRVTRSRK